MSGPASYESLELPFQRHSDSSREAAERAQEGRPSALRRVWVCFLMHPEGLTDEAGAELLRMNPSTYRPRRVELARPRYARDGSLVRPAILVADGAAGITRSGRSADVWRVAFPEMNGGWEP